MIGNARVDSTRHLPRSSIDAGRPPVDPAIVGIPQGWDDDLTMEVPGQSTVRATRRLPTHYTPLRQRVKLGAFGPKDKQATIAPRWGVDSTRSNVDISNVDADAALPTPTESIRMTKGGSSRHQGSRSGSGLFGQSRKRHLGDSIYRVGYEREVLDV